MKRGFKVFLWILILPVICYAIFLYAGHSMNQTLRNAILETAPAEENITAQDVQGVQAGYFCNDPEVSAKISSFCTNYQRMQLAKLCAIVTPIASLFFITLIVFLAAKARRDRNILLKYFKPALYFTAFFIILLIAANIIILVAALYYGMAAAFHAIAPKLILLIFGAGLLGLYAVIKSLWMGLKRPLITLAGANITKDENPQIWALTQEVAHSLNIPAPDNIVAGLDPTFYATESDIEIESFMIKGQTVYISLPFCRILTKEELKGIIGHELAHFAGDDVVFSTKFYPIYMSADNAIAIMRESSSQNIIFAASLFPAITIFKFFMDAFSELEAEISRERELLADKTSADKVAGIMPVGSGLIKAHAYTPLFVPVYEAMDKAIPHNPIKNMAALYEDMAKQATLETLKANIREQEYTTVNDTHPTLEGRLQNLGLSLESCLPAALEIPAESAVKLFRNYEDMEERQTDFRNNLAIIFFDQQQKATK